MTMNLRHRFALGILAAAIAGTATAEPAARSGTRVLFDGKSLDGWKPAPFYKPGAVKVDDGAVVLEKGKPMTGITSTRDDLPKVDYELIYEAKRLSGRDFFAAATFPVGKSFVTFVNGGWGGTITGISSINGADASENETGKYFKYENNTWYRFRVVVTAAVVRCWIDDKPVVVLEHSDRALGTRVETRSNQPLGFATYDSVGVLRKVEIRALTAAEVVAADKVEE